MNYSDYEYKIDSIFDYVRVLASGLLLAPWRLIVTITLRLVFVSKKDLRSLMLCSLGINAILLIGSIVVEMRDYTFSLMYSYIVPCFLSMVILGILYYVVDLYQDLNIIKKGKGLSSNLKDDKLSNISNAFLGEKFREVTLYKSSYELDDEEERLQKEEILKLSGVTEEIRQDTDEVSKEELVVDTVQEEDDCIVSSDSAIPSSQKLEIIEDVPVYNIFGERIDSIPEGVSDTKDNISDDEEKEIDEQFTDNFLKDAVESGDNISDVEDAMFEDSDIQNNEMIESFNMIDNFASLSGGYYDEDDEDYSSDDEDDYQSNRNSI